MTTTQLTDDSAKIALGRSAVHEQSSDRSAPPSPVPAKRGQLVRKYFIVFGFLVAAALIASGSIEIYYSYFETHAQIAKLQSELAAKAGLNITQFILSIEDQLKSAAVSLAVAGGANSDMQFDLAKLLAVVPAVTEVSATDRAGKMQAYLSRFRALPEAGMDDTSRSPAFIQAKQGVRYFGPVSFENETDPFMIVAVPIEQFPGRVIGVLRAKISLNQIAEVMRDLRFSTRGYGYITNRAGELIAHSDPGAMLQHPNLVNLPQVRVAFQFNQVVPEARTMTARDLDGGNVLTAYIFLPNLDWTVFIEQPLVDAHRQLYNSLLRTAAILLLALVITLGASVIITRRVVRPLAILRTSVERIGAGELDHRIEIKTGDEIEMLAEEFNNMVGKLNASYHLLEDQVRQRTSEITALFDVTRIATQSLNIETVLGQVVQKIKELFNVDNVRIYSFAQNQDAIPLRAMAGQFDTSVDLSPLRRGKGIIAKVAKSGEPKIFHDIHNDPSYDELSQNGAAKALGFRFFAVIPIKLKGKVLGIIACNSRSARILSEEEQRLLVALADPIGPALENLHLFEELKEKSSALEAANRELVDSLAQQTAVAGTLRVMAGSPSNLQAVFDAILADAAKLTQVTGGVVRLLDGAGTLRFVARYGRSGQSLGELQQVPLPADENSATTKALRERRPVQIDDIQCEASAAWRVPVAPGPWHTALAIPLLQDNEAIGAIVLFRDVVEPFTEQQIELLSTFADQAVIAIKNATLFQDLQARTHDLQMANEKLTQLDKLKSGFLSNVSHELKTPLTAIGSLVDNMIDGLTGPLNDKQTHYIGGIKESTERLTRLIHDLLDISVIESGRIELKLSPFSVPELIGEVAETLTPVAEQKSILLVLPSANGDVMVWADRDKIAQVLTNLIGNAVKFTPPNGKVELGLEKSGDGRWIEVAVSDTGPGIPPREARLIFDEFYQIHQPGQEKIKGVGLGLAICKKLIDMHGGNISLTSEIGQGSTFHFTLPALREDSATAEFH